MSFSEIEKNKIRLKMIIYKEKRLDKHSSTFYPVYNEIKLEFHLWLVKKVF